MKFQETEHVRKNLNFYSYDLNFSQLPTHCKLRISRNLKINIDSGGASCNSQTETRNQRCCRNFSVRRYSTFIQMKSFLILLTLSQALAKGPDSGHFNRVIGHGSNSLEVDNIFLQKNYSDFTAQAGATAALPCKLTSSLADGMVSWVRRRDYHLLTVGRQVYSSDARVGVKVSPDGCDWTLTVRWVKTHDAGIYECQVSSHPPQALMVNLRVVEAHAEIMGASERFIHSGSSLILVCLLKGATEPPTFVFWYRSDRMINYDKERGVAVDNTKKFSKLYVSSVSREDEGNYTCFPSNASPASVYVTVVQRENPAGLQQETNTEKEDSSQTSSSSSSSSSPASSSTTNGGVVSSANAYISSSIIVIVGLYMYMFQPTGFKKHSSFTR